LVDILASEKSLILYGTLGCHLCELAEQLLLPYVTQGWQVELLDIAEDDYLLEQFSLTIPVLKREISGALLLWPFDVQQLAAFLCVDTATQKGG
jgi:hypothetical protein